MKVIAFSLLFCALAYANNACHDFYNSKSTTRFVGQISVNIGSSIPLEKHQEIFDAVASVQAISESLLLPNRVSFNLSKSDAIVPEGAHLMEDRIEISRIALISPESSFKALISHELTHLIVIRNFTTREGKSLLQDWEPYRDDNARLFMMAMGHTSLAELLCDLMGVLTTGRLPVFRDFSNFYKNNLHLISPEYKFEFETPVDLSVRDFSVSHEDPRWKNYQPKDQTYNSLNQIRAYLGQRWISKMDPAEYPRFFATVLAATNIINKSQFLMTAPYMMDQKEINPQVIEFLEDYLQENFVNKKE